MLIGGALDVALAFNGVEPVDGGFIGRDLAVELNLSNEGGATMLEMIALDIVQHDLLFLCERVLHQTRSGGTQVTTGLSLNVTIFLSGGQRKSPERGGQERGDFGEIDDWPTLAF